MVAPTSLLFMHETRYGTLGPSYSQEVYAVEKGESELNLFKNGLHRLGRETLSP